MARLTGSDDLYRLIYSLTTEEKGYFKKFALRHTSHGNAYLQLFDVICSQAHTDEKILKRGFSNYPKLKMYLKEILVECLLVYHRKSHPHIALLGQLQKIHLMIIKGLYDEAFKMLGKAIDDCVQMELFTIARYLLHMDMELKALTYNNASDLKKLKESYSSSAHLNAGEELNLTQLELLGITWLGRARDLSAGREPEHLLNQGVYDGPETSSVRAQIKKLSVEFYLDFVKGDLHGRYQITKKQVTLVQNFRGKHDTSYNVIPVISNHIVNCLALGKYTEAEQLCTKMISAEAKVRLHYDLAFTWGNLYKWTAYFSTGKFEKGLNEIETTRHEMLKLYDSVSDNLRLRGARVYDKIKIMYLFANQKFGECWLFIHDSMSTLKHDTDATADILMVQMMVQLELGNFEFLKGMAQKAEKKLSAQRTCFKDYEPLIRFFKLVTAGNSNKLALQVLQEMKTHHTAQSLKVFGLLGYGCWLESKCSTKTLQELMKREASKKTQTDNKEKLQIVLINEEIF